ncbi:Hpt domain-containing protein [Synechococcus sp. PCC 6717]|nr:Hpt domain-containing protein [Synechococcus sp. PCC 6717]
MASLIDWDYLAALSGGDRDFEQELLQTFVEDAQLRLASLAAAVASGNLDQVKRDAHHLKGSSGNVGVTAIQNIAAQLEQQTTLAAAQPLVDELQQLYQAVVSEVAA